MVKNACQFEMYQCPLSNQLSHALLWIAIRTCQINFQTDLFVTANVVFVCQTELTKLRSLFRHHHLFITNAFKWKLSYNYKLKTQSQRTNEIHAQSWTQRSVRWQSSVISETKNIKIIFSHVQTVNISIIV